MERLIIAALLAVAVGMVALLLRRRDATPDGPTQPRTYAAPIQVDRNDFDRPDAEWLVISFTSMTCATCADVRGKVAILSSADVAVHDAEVAASPDLHEKYQIDAVPIVAVADSSGVVRASFIGPVSSTHLWGAIAELRDPGSVPPGCGASPADPSAH